MKRQRIASRLIIVSLFIFGCAFAQQVVATPTPPPTSTPTKPPTATPVPPTATPIPPDISGNLTGDKTGNRYLVLCKITDSGCEVTAMTATSDARGYFEFYAVPSGRYYIFYDSGHENFNEAVKKWGGKTIQIGNVEWLVNNYVTLDSEGKLSFTLVKNMVLDQNGVYMAVYRFFATSPFLWAHKCATNCAVPDDVIPVIATVSQGNAARVEFEAYGPFGELSGEKPSSSAGAPAPVITPAIMAGAPVVTSVDLREESSSNGLVVFQDISFIDSDGDVIRVDYEIISSTTPDAQVEGGSVDIPAVNQKKGAVITGEWGCGNGSSEVTLQVILTDRKGNKSAPVEYTIVCK